MLSVQEMKKRALDEMKEEFLSIIRTVIDYINGAAYLFQDSSVKSGC